MMTRKCPHFPQMTSPLLVKIVVVVPYKNIQQHTVISWTDVCRIWAVSVAFFILSQLDDGQQCFTGALEKWD